MREKDNKRSVVQVTKPQRQCKENNMAKHIIFYILGFTALIIILVFQLVSVSDLLAYSQQWTQKCAPNYNFTMEQHLPASMGPVERSEIVGELSASDVTPGKSIYFIISAKVTNETTVPIKARQACGIESAAYQHPEKDVFVIIVTPDAVSRLNVSLTASATALLEYPNIHMRLIHMKSFLQGTPMLALHDKWLRSQYPVEHTADILRYTILFKYGGLYLDTDVILLKRMPEYDNYIGRNKIGRSIRGIYPIQAFAMYTEGCESDVWIGAGIINYGMDKVGREVAYDSALELVQAYNPEVYAAGGPGVVTTVLYRRCNLTKNSVTLAGKECGGFHITAPYEFYGLPYDYGYIYYTKGRTSDILLKIENSTTIHYWNYLTWQMKANERGIPFFDLAAQFCPVCFKRVRQFF